MLGEGGILFRRPEIIAPADAAQCVGRRLGADAREDIVLIRRLTRLRVKKAKPERWVGNYRERVRRGCAPIAHRTVAVIRQHWLSLRWR